MHRPLAAATLITAGFAAGALLAPAAAQDEMQMFECIAQKKLMGREEAVMESGPARWPDGRLREMEKGAAGYTGLGKGEPVPEWLDLYATPQGHGNTFLGFYLSKDFICKGIEG